jgi:hypothetical protein
MKVNINFGCVVNGQCFTRPVQQRTGNINSRAVLGGLTEFRTRTGAVVSIRERYRRIDARWARTQTRVPDQNAHNVKC